MRRRARRGDERQRGERQEPEHGNPARRVEPVGEPCPEPHAEGIGGGELRDQRVRDAAAVEREPEAREKDWRRDRGRESARARPVPPADEQERPGGERQVAEPLRPRPAGGGEGEDREPSRVLSGERGQERQESGHQQQREERRLEPRPRLERERRGDGEGERRRRRQQAPGPQPARRDAGRDRERRGGERADPLHDREQSAGAGREIGRDGEQHPEEVRVADRALVEAVGEDPVVHQMPGVRETDEGVVLRVAAEVERVRHDDEGRHRERRGEGSACPGRRAGAHVTGLMVRSSARRLGARLGADHQLLQPPPGRLQSPHDAPVVHLA